MKSLYIVLVAIAVCAVSCRTKEGAPGPAGESDLTQQGTISGTLAYKDNNGNDVNIPFSYSYFESQIDNRFYYDDSKEAYVLNFFRRDLKDYDNYLYFSNLSGAKANGQFAGPVSGSFAFSLLKVTGNDLFQFQANFDASDPNSSYTITNFVFDPATGRTVYDFVLTIDPSAIDYEGRYDETTTATITGRIDVILNRTSMYPSQPALD